MRIELHAGLKKTGTTAIQLALARNAGALQRAGVFVPDMESPPAPGAARRTPGNAAALALAAEEAVVDPRGATARLGRIAAALAGVSSPTPLPIRPSRFG